MKKLTSKKDTKRRSELGFNIILVSVGLMFLAFLAGEYIGASVICVVTLCALSLVITILGSVVILLAFIERRYTQIIKELWNNDYLSDERYNSLFQEIDDLRSNMITEETLIDEIREVKNLDENLP